MWPISPAAPLAPIYTCPPNKKPAPIPVPTLIYTMSCMPRAAPKAHSPSAPRSASLSSLTGLPHRACMRSRIGKPSQPGMIGGAVTKPCPSETGPGTPAASTRSAGSWRPPVRRCRSRTNRSTCCRQASGPRSIGHGLSISPSTWAARSVTTRVRWVAPMSMPISRPACGLRSSITERRPPFELRLPISRSTWRSSKSLTRPVIAARLTPRS